MAERPFVMGAATLEDLPNLEALEKAPFEPMGWLYQNIYAGLFERGLVVKRVSGFWLSEAGRSEITRLRAIVAARAAAEVRHG